MVAEDLAGEWSGWFLITIATIFPEEDAGHQHQRSIFPGQSLVPTYSSFENPP